MQVGSKSVQGIQVSKYLLNVFPEARRPWHRMMSCWRCALLKSKKDVGATIIYVMLVRSA